MRRHASIAGIAGGTLAALARGAAGQPAAALPLIGVLGGTTAQPGVVRPFLEGVAQAGPQVGRDVAVAYRWADDRPERLAALMAELLRLPVAVVVSISGAPTGSGLLVLGDPMFGRHRLLITELTQRLQVPAIFGGRPYVAAGGLMSYLSSDAWHWRSAAGYIDKILKGAKPADLPVAQPTTFELIVNLKTAKALGITLPASLLLRADEVIE